MERLRRPRIRAMSLMYHDVVERGNPDSSGFPGKGPARYKLDWPLFHRHLAAIAAEGRSAGSVLEITAPERRIESWPLLLTFDDGGASAEPIGSALSDVGWIGHFFITVDYIGNPGFLDESGIRRLAQMGHVIGTHSCSHHVPFNRLPEEQMVAEWRRSTVVLNEIAGNAIVVGSVPGGYYSPLVARSAALSGVKALFTSQPVVTCQQLDRSLVLGRYAILSGTPPKTVARLARGELTPRLRQFASWKARGVVKLVLGDAYRTLRTRLLERA